MKPMWIVIALACCVGAFFLGRASRTPADGDGPASGAASPEAVEDAPELATATGQIARAQRALETEKKKHAETQAALEEVRKKIAAAGLDETGSPTLETEAATAKSKGPRYVFPAVTGVLPDADWPATGEALAKMSPLLAEFAESLAAGKGLPSSIGELQRWNAPLLSMALDAQKKGVSGTGIPGVFSNVALAVNMMHATLAQTDTPLTDNQSESLGAIANRYVAEDERRLAAYDESTFQLVKEIEEAALKDRFYAEALALMTPAQEELLHPKAVRGRLGLDLFSSSVLWNGLCAQIQFRDEAGLKKQLAELVMQRAQIPSDSRTLVEGLVADWVRGMPSEYLSEEPDALHKATLDLPGGNTGMPLARAQIAAEHELRFLRALHDRLPADSDVAKRVRQAPIVAVPVFRKAE